MDLVVRGGTVVTGGTRSVADIGIVEGRIAQLGGEMTGAREIDAAGRHVLPGGIDMHVHVTPPGTSWRFCDDFETGSRAALAGGITTVGNIAFPHRGETMADALARDVADGMANSLCDFVIHPVLMEPTPENLDQIEVLAKEGHTSVKIFLSFRRFDRNVADFLEGMRRIQAAGSIALVHCEDIGMMDCCCAILADEGRTEPRYYPLTRPVAAERVATERAVGYCEITGCPTYVVHLASEAALKACTDGRARGLPVYVETRPLYLHLTSERHEEPDGAKYAGAPPLRGPSDRDAMWNGLAQADIATLCTDHAPWMLAEKVDPELEAKDLKQGVADLETMLPMLWSEGVRTGRLTVERFVEVTSTNAARIFGLYPRKGTIAVGSDADLVIWDEEETRVVDGASMHSNSDFTPYDGWEVTGWPAVTILRGEVVAEGSDVLAGRGRAQNIARGPHQPL